MKNGQITFFDIDETLFMTGNNGAKIIVIKNNKIYKRLSNSDFNTYILKAGESFDFSEFASAEVFVSTTPNKIMIDKIKAIHKLSTFGSSEVFILTARQDFDNVEVFLDYMRSHGIDVGHHSDGKIHVIRVGNISGFDNAHKKAAIIRKKLQSGNFNKVRFYDDTQSNIDAFDTLGKEFPKITFKSFLI